MIVIIIDDNFDDDDDSLHITTYLPTLKSLIRARTSDICH
jgi:hypothetical protein